MGSSVGFAVGLSLGNKDGYTDGLAEGEPVGLEEGSSEGVFEGETVGCFVGFFVGETVGCLVGDFVGAGVGAEVVGGFVAHLSTKVHCLIPAAFTFITVAELASQHFFALPQAGLVRGGSKLEHWSSAST